jgi:hypothetical protein
MDFSHIRGSVDLDVVKDFDLWVAIGLASWCLPTPERIIIAFGNIAIIEFGIYYLQLVDVRFGMND